MTGVASPHRAGPAHDAPREVDIAGRDRLRCAGEFLRSVVVPDAFAALESPPVDLLRLNRKVAWAGLALVIAVSWAYLLWMAKEMYGMDPSCPMHNVGSSWTFDYFWMTFTMWTVMMVAMMTPSVAPMVLTFTTVNTRRAQAGRIAVPTWIFLSGYLVIWTAFSLLATGLQWALHAAALLAPVTLSVGPLLGGILLAAAGLYQFTGIKNACLDKCTSPLGFLMTEWREGPLGAFVMGLRHGVFCTGCCAFLMILLFVAGVMNLLWIALLGALVLIEKLAPAHRLTARVFGFIFVLAGVVLTAEAYFRS